MTKIDQVCVTPGRIHIRWIAHLVKRAPHVQRLSPSCSGRGFNSDLWPFAACHSPSLSLSPFTSLAVLYNKGLKCPKNNLKNYFFFFFKSIFVLVWSSHRWSANHKGRERADETGSTNSANGNSASRALVSSMVISHSPGRPGFRRRAVLISGKVTYSWHKTRLLVF